MIFRLTEDMYRKTKCSMKNGSVVFETTLGVRQGGSESPCLYNLYAGQTLNVF